MNLLSWRKAGRHLYYILTKTCIQQLGFIKYTPFFRQVTRHARREPGHRFLLRFEPTQKATIHCLNSRVTRNWPHTPSIVGEMVLSARTHGPENQVLVFKVLYIVHTRKKTPMLLHVLYAYVCGYVQISSYRDFYCTLTQKSFWKMRGNEDEWTCFSFCFICEMFCGKNINALHLGICLQRVVLPQKRKWALWTHFQHVSLVLQKHTVGWIMAANKKWLPLCHHLQNTTKILYPKTARVFSPSCRSFSKRWFSKRQNATPKTQTQTSKLYMLQGWHWRIKASEMDGNGRPTPRIPLEKTQPLNSPSAAMEHRTSPQLGTSMPSARTDVATTMETAPSCHKFL